MTIKEIYNWAKQHDCLNITISKNSNFSIYDITSITHLKEEFSNISDDHDKVILD